MTKKPETPAEIMRFVNEGVWQLLRQITSDLEAVKQITARASDALTDYEKALKSISRDGSYHCRVRAREALRKHKIKG